jgi:hypothetical protein
LIFLIGLLAFLYLFEVNYNLYELKLGLKARLGQQLTLEEMKSTSIYKVYKQISTDTTVEEINRLLDKKDTDHTEKLRTWYYPYGYVSILLEGDNESKVSLKIVNFKTPYIIKLTKEELYEVFKCASSMEIKSMLGEPAIMTASNTDGKAFIDNSYEWGIQTAISKETIEELEELYGNYANFPERYTSPVNFLMGIKMERKLRLHVSINEDNTVERISIEEYRY